MAATSTSSAAIAVAAALAVASSEHAARWLAGDVAQELGRFAEGGSNLDQLAGAGAAEELSSAVLAVPALDRG